MQPKLKYLLTSLRKTLLRQDFDCPNCLNSRSSHVSSKYLVTSLKRCLNCNLLFRAPITTDLENKKFYQDDYQEGFTTDMPPADILAKWTSRSFADTPKDFRHVIEMLRTLTTQEDARICDFGCSWGYGSWQFKNAGFRVQAFEISEPRAAYARTQLGVDVVTQTTNLTAPFDLFFSSHVLEHVPSVNNAIDLGFRLLKSGGYFVALTPNGSKAFKKKDPNGWHLSWGQKHPNLLDEVYYQHKFATNSYLIESSPIDRSQLRRWVKEPAQLIGKLDGNELFVVAQKL